MWHPAKFSFDLFQLKALQRQQRLVAAELAQARRQAKLAQGQTCLQAKQQLGKPEALAASFAVGALTGLQPPRQRFGWLRRLQPFASAWLQQKLLSASQLPTAAQAPAATELTPTDESEPPNSD